MTENADLAPAAYRNYPAPPVSEETPKQEKKRRQRSFPPAPEPLPVPVVDNHTHLNFRPEFGTITARQAMDAAEGVGVNRGVQVGFDLDSSRFTIEAIEDEPRLLGAVALHPNDAARLKADGRFDEQFAEIVELSRHPRVRAIGETGLDYFRTGEDLRDGQRESFEEHIALAKERDIALMIHDRDAHEDVVATLKRVGAPEKVVFHCFSGDEDLAAVCMENGWYMSFAGTVTFSNSPGIQAACAIADPELMLVETDAPFLTPAPYRGRPNASYMIPTTVRFMAELRGEDLVGLCAQLSANSETVYGSWLPA
ncbi:TatD family hydrolase [Haematomicrobium sanguinis]|uniref:TatD family hydrolase n=1 Tax=Haematomicrobium sanguinis TaxID=479106 RepID=UPI00047A77E5